MSEPNPEAPRQTLGVFAEALDKGFFTDQEKEAFLGRFTKFIHPDNLTDGDKREFLVGVIRMGLSGVVPQEVSEERAILNVARILDKGKEAPYER